MVNKKWWTILKLDKKFTTKHQSTIDEKHFDPVIKGLEDVYNFGTASGLKVEGLRICGKTGTAENKIRVAGKTYQLKDHSIFVAFAPAEDPKIAIAVFIENGYWGSRWAGPIATLMIEKYVNGEISRVDLENRMLNGSIQDEYRKIDNIIYQTNETYTKVKDSINKIEIKKLEAKKEEEN